MFFAETRPRDIKTSNVRVNQMNLNEYYPQREISFLLHWTLHFDQFILFSFAFFHQLRLLLSYNILYISFLLVEEDAAVCRNFEQQRTKEKTLRRFET